MIGRLSPLFCIAIVMACLVITAQASLDNHRRYQRPREDSAFLLETEKDSTPSDASPSPSDLPKGTFNPSTPSKHASSWMRRHNNEKESRKAHLLRHNRESYSSPSATTTFAKRDDTILSISPYGELSNNDTFAEEFCALLTTSINQVLITPDWTERWYWQLPECLSGPNGTNVTSFLGINLILPSFNAIPASASAIEILNSYMFPNETSPIDGYEEDGSIAWSEVWSNFPNLTSISISKAKHFHGTIPTSLPAEIFKFSLIESNITGTIPSSLFSNMNPNITLPSFELTLKILPITGGVPSGLFLPLAGSKVKSTFTFALESNHQLTGTIPGDILDPLKDIESNWFTMDLFEARLTGPLPSTLSFPSGLLNASYPFNRFRLDLSSTTFEGPLPNGLFANPLTVGNLALRFENGLFNGPLPASFLSQFEWHGESSFLSMSFENNDFSGTIPDDLFSSSLKRNTTFLYIGLELSSNQLEGDIPATLLYTLQPIIRSADSDDLADRSLQLTWHNFDRDSSTALSSTATAVPIEYVAVTSQNIFFRADDNKLSGSLPANLFTYSVLPSSIKMTSIYISLSMNGLEGPIPEEWFATVPQASSLNVNIDLSENHLTGQIPSFCFPSSSLNLYLQSNMLNGTIPSLVGCKVDILSIANNPLIDLCSSNASFASFTGICSVTSTDACNCLDMYPRCERYCYTPFYIPITNPASLTHPSTNPSSPSSLCKSPPPTPEFTCINGVWTASSTNVTTLTIPSNSGSIVITGNVTSSSIVFEGVIGTTIVIDGCANNLSTIVIQFTQEEVLKIGKSGSKSFTLLTQSNSSSGSSCNSLSNVALSSHVAHGCRKIATDKVVSNNGNTLSVALSVDMSGCNRWWIILVSIVVVVVILGAVGIAIGAVILKSKSQKRSLASLRG